MSAAPAAHPSDPLDGTVVVPTACAFDELFSRLERAILGNGLLVIAKPSASRNAAARGVEIPGNGMLLTFNNDFALRLLGVSAEAGFEAPMRFYVTESPDRTARVTYRLPSALLKPYGHPGLEAVGRDLDQVFAKIVADALGASPPKG